MNLCFSREGAFRDFPMSGDALSVVTVRGPSQVLYSELTGQPPIIHCATSNGSVSRILSRNPDRRPRPFTLQQWKMAGIHPGRTGRKKHGVAVGSRF